MRIRSKMIETLICPNANGCEIYSAWSRISANSRIDVIESEKLGSPYCCLALKQIRENPIRKNPDNQRGKLRKLPLNVECLNIRMLNLAEGAE